jgi:hypothetical protein
MEDPFNGPLIDFQIPTIPIKVNFNDERKALKFKDVSRKEDA